MDNDQNRIVKSQDIMNNTPICSRWDILPINIIKIIFEYDSTYKEHYNMVIMEYHAIVFYNNKQAVYLTSRWFNKIDLYNYKSNLFTPIELYQLRFDFHTRMQKNECMLKISHTNRKCSFCSGIVKPNRYRFVLPYKKLFCSKLCHESYEDINDNNTLPKKLFPTREILQIRSTPNNKNPFYFSKPVFENRNIYYPNYWKLSETTEQWERVIISPDMENIRRSSIFCDT